MSDREECCLSVAIPQGAATASSAEDTTLGFAELQRRAGLPKGTLHRTLGDPVAARLLDRAAGRYRLSGLVLELGMRASVERGLPEVATPFLEDLYVRTHELVHLGIREGTEVVYVATRRARDCLAWGLGADRPHSSGVGGRIPGCQAVTLPKRWLAGASGSLP